MNEDELGRIRRTWAKVIPAREIVGRIFYAKLFEIAPAVRPMFPGDMEGQEAKLVDTLDFIVDHLDDPDAMLPEARNLAIRHVAYGTVPDHYGAVGAALISTLEQALGPDFGDAEKAAWTTAFGGLAAEMIRAAYPESAS